MISETTYRELLRKWKRARLNRDQGSLGFPTVNILHPEHGSYQKGDGIPYVDFEFDPDIDAFQQCVDALAPELRSVFEAFHLGVIHGTYLRKTPHRARAHRLRVGEMLYKKRQRAATENIRHQLLTIFD
jgi:hypothetical protein